MWLPGLPIFLLGQHIAPGQCARAFPAALRKLPGLTHSTRHSQSARLGRNLLISCLVGFLPALSAKASEALVLSEG